VSGMSGMSGMSGTNLMNQFIPQQENWKYYYPFVHMFAGASIFDKITFRLFYILNNYIISPNLHPLLYYYLFFKIIFDTVQSYYKVISSTVFDFIDWIFKNSKFEIAKSIKDWTRIFVTWSFLCHIPIGLLQFRLDPYPVSIFKSILFVVIYGIMMAFIDTSAMIVVLYFILYSFFGMTSSKSGILNTIYGIDLYFFKKIKNLADPKSTVLNFIINNLFLFIFELIAIYYLLRGMNEYITKIEAVELKISLCLTNAILIYVIYKYCKYKFTTLLPRYNNDLDNYDEIMNTIFDRKIPIKKYANFNAKALNKHKLKINKVYGENDSTLEKFKKTFTNVSQLSKNAAKTMYNTAAAPVVNAATLNKKRMNKDISKNEEDLFKKYYNTMDQYNETKTNLDAKKNIRGGYWGGNNDNK
jgi:hypothetical protein